MPELIYYSSSLLQGNYFVFRSSVDCQFTQGNLRDEEREKC